MAREYIEREAFGNRISNTDWYSINKDGNLIAGASDGDTALFKARDIFEAIHEQPAADVVSRSVFEQVKWERDIAMEQLNDHKIPFGCIAPDVVEVVRCTECRWAVLPHPIYRHLPTPPSYLCQITGICVTPNDYCSNGERKEV